MSMLEHIIMIIKTFFLNFANRHGCRKVLDNMQIIQTCGIRYPANYKTAVKIIGETDGDMSIKVVNIYGYDFTPFNDR